MSRFIADHVCPRAVDLSPALLADLGVRLLLADLDNTLIPYTMSLPTDELHAWRDALADRGVTLCVISNNRNPDRVINFCKALDVPYITHAHKPRRDGFDRALAQMALTPDRTVMIGDQIFTDVLGAHRAGIRAVLVRPISLRRYPLRALRYVLEGPFRRRSAGRNLAEAEIF